MHSPDIVGNIRIDQAWGLFQVSAAAHEVNASYNVLGASSAPTAASEISGHPDTKWGGSVMAALNIKNIPTGAGDDIKIDATYAKGDTKNVISTSGASPNFAMFSGSGNGAYQSIGFGATTDGVYLPGSTDGIKLTEAYGVRGAFNTTGIRTGRPACSAATLPCGMVATRPTSPLPRVLIALPTSPTMPVRSLRISPAIRTSTYRSSVWLRAGLPSRT